MEHKQKNIQATLPLVHNGQAKRICAGATNRSSDMNIWCVISTMKMTTKTNAIVWGLNANKNKTNEKKNRIEIEILIDSNKHEHKQRFIIGRRFSKDFFKEENFNLFKTNS